MAKQKMAYLKRKLREFPKLENVLVSGAQKNKNI